MEAALRPLAHLTVSRHGNTVVARTSLGLPERVVIAGHLDTVPVNANLPARTRRRAPARPGHLRHEGRVAVMLKIAATVPAPNRDITFLFYESEEIEEEHNGLRVLSQSRPDLLEADFAILMEPSDAVIEAGCQGSMRVDVTVRGERAHTARSWKGVNAIHRAGEILDRLNAYEARMPVIDGLEYHEGLNAVFIDGGVAGNVLPDVCTVQVNHRFAPDRSEAEAAAYVKEFFAGFEVVVTDSAPVRCRASTGRRPRSSSRPSAARSTRSSAGPTSPASRPSACPPSTSGRATRCWPTSRRSSSRSSTSSGASRCCAPGSGAERPDLWTLSGTRCRKSPAFGDSGSVPRRYVSRVPS